MDVGGWDPDRSVEVGKKVFSKNKRPNKKIETAKFLR